MTPGTATPTAPSADLIERFNAIIDGLLAALAVESMRAAGVPWPLRMILAPLLRRRIARWSAAFSAMVADARAGRNVERAKDSPADLAVERPRADTASDTMSLPDRVLPVSGGGVRRTARDDSVRAADVVPLCEEPAPRRHFARQALLVRSAAMIGGADRRERPNLPCQRARGNARRRPPPAVFPTREDRGVRTSISLRSVNEKRRELGGWVRLVVDIGRQTSVGSQAIDHRR
jgi:hypothetical protein